MERNDTERDDLARRTDRDAAVKDDMRTRNGGDSAVSRDAAMPNDRSTSDDAKMRDRGAVMHDERVDMRDPSDATANASAPTRPSAAPAEDGEALLAADATTSLRTRWQQIQVGFVDEPQAAVRDADALVNEAVAQLTEGFTRQRKTLEQALAGGHDSTEEMRVALQRYRAFFERLLSI